MQLLPLAELRFVLCWLCHLIHLSPLDLVSTGAVNVLNLFISVGLSSAAASLGELGKAMGALERMAQLVTPSQAAAGSSSGGDVGGGIVGSSEAALTSTSGEAVHGSSSNGGSSGSTSCSPAAAAAAAEQPEASSSGRVEFRDVWFKYPGAADWAVRGLNITLLPGQVRAWRHSRGSP